jgi:hypothetical protein
MPTQKEERPRLSGAAPTTNPQPTAPPASFVQFSSPDAHGANDSLDFVGLLDRLGYTDDDPVVISHKAPGDDKPTVHVFRAIDAPQHVDTLPDGVDVWFNVNKTNLPLGLSFRRGREGDVTQLVAAYADLDFKPGGCGNEATARAVIDDLSALLGTRPAAVVRSGNGLQPYWPLDGAHVDEHGTAGLAALLRRFGLLVKAVAAARNASVDSVFDLPRMLRVPDTFNCKAAPVQVISEVDTGGPLTVGELTERLDEYGIPGVEENEHSGEIVSPPSEWGYADRTCIYVKRMVDGWRQENPTDRNPWLYRQGIRLACAHRRGCFTRDGYAEALRVLTSTHQAVRRVVRPARRRPPRQAIRNRRRARQRPGESSHEN